MKNMLPHFTANDEMEILLGNEEATFRLCLFVKNPRSHDISKTADAEIGVRPTPIPALGKGLDLKGNLPMNRP